MFVTGSVVKPAAIVAVVVVMVETISCDPTTNMTNMNATFQYQRGLILTDCQLYLATVTAVGQCNSSNGVVYCATIIMVSKLKVRSSPFNVQ
jgi:hypothetical protein